MFFFSFCCALSINFQFFFFLFFVLIETEKISTNIFLWIHKFLLDFWSRKFEEMKFSFVGIVPNPSLLYPKKYKYPRCNMRTSVCDHNFVVRRKKFTHGYQLRRKEKKNKSWLTTNNIIKLPFFLPVFIY